METQNQTPFEPFDEMQFSDYQCFLCGKFLEGDDTREHVFPMWLLHHFDLLDQRINLLNRTSIPYRQLTIPCCLECNTEHLSATENAVEEAFHRGPEEVKKLDPLILYQWTGKIFYGLLFRELSLLAERSDPEIGYITNPEFMESYRTLHGFLQSTRTQVDFHEFLPGSVFVFQIGEEPEFDFSDNFVGMAFCIRMGNVGIVTCLKDDGLMSDIYSDLYEAINDIPLLPIQFDEFCAIVFYRSSSIIREGKYVTISSNGGEATVVKIPGYSMAPHLDDWDTELYAQFLESFWSKYGYTIDDIFKPPDQIKTCLNEYAN